MKNIDWHFTFTECTFSLDWFVEADSDQYRMHFGRVQSSFVIDLIRRVWNGFYC